MCNLIKNIFNNFINLFIKKNNKHNNINNVKMDEDNSELDLTCSDLRISEISSHVTVEYVSEEDTAKFK
jgi:hypothetical protein